MVIATCRECKKQVSSNAKSCPHCGNPINTSSPASSCLLVILLGIAILMVLALLGRDTDPDIRKPSLEISRLSGTFVSSTDPRWKLQISEALSSGDVYGGWNGTIRLYGPVSGFDGLPCRCRVFGEILAVELIYDGETTIIKAFRITDANTLTCTLPNYWPGIMRKQSLSKSQTKMKDEYSEKVDVHILYSKHDNLAVRESPSDSAPILITVQTGHEFVEIAREESWAQVGVSRTGKVGWVPVSSTTFTQKSGHTETPETEEFRKFKAAFQHLNESVKTNTGILLFSDAQDMGDGIIYVTATDAWLRGNKEQQHSSLNTVFNLWEAAEGSGFPIAVLVKDAKGNLVMKKSGP